MRAASVLRNAAKGAAVGAPKPMSADQSLYHLMPTGFWKKFRDAVVVNPEISSGLPLPTMNRYPQPGSRTERYSTPATKASDPAFNPYYKRDVRRAYPQTSTITQTTLSSLLLSSPSVSALPAPETATEVPRSSNAVSLSASGNADAQTAVVTSSVPPLAAVIDKLPAGKAFLGSGIQTGTGTGALPPLPPAKVGGKWVPKSGADIPHAPDAYFPMVGYN
ncbi:hypothetical protein Q5752_000465 [Cryptotrichosporon argae]